MNISFLTAAGNIAGFIVILTAISIFTIGTAYILYGVYKTLTD